MKKFILAAVIMLASTVAFAQHSAGSFTVQPRIGFSAADFNNTDDTKARVGLVVGPEFEYYLTNKFSIAGALLYSQQGAEQDKVDVTYKLDYINVPIVANFYVLKGLALKAGLQPGFNVNAKIDAGKGTEQGNFEDAVKKFDLSIPVGLSYEFYNFVLDARYNLGLTKIFDEDKINLDSKNLTFQLTLGYKFTLF